MELLYRLLSIYLHQEGSLDKPLTEEQWYEVYDLAKNHSVLGILQGVVDMLPEDQKPARRVKIRLALISEKIINANKEMQDKTVVLYKQIKDMGRRSTLLKGQGIAMLYPNPELRQSGDIDLWVEGDRKSTISLLRKKWMVKDIFYHHCDTDVFSDRTKVEIHFTPTWMNNPIHNKRLQKFFEQHSDEQFSNYFLDLGYAKTNSAMNCVFCLIHLYRHVLFEGVGLRQLMDYFFVLRNSSTEDRQVAAKMCKELGMVRFAGAVMYLLSEKFGLEQKYLILKPSKQYGEFLIKEVELSGNFGQSDERNKTAKETNFFKRAYYRMCHIANFIRIAPSEVLWAPYFKIWQKIWKMRNRF